MRKINIITLAGFSLMVMGLASCATVPYGLRDGKAESLAQLFVDGEWEILKLQSVTPFLFDGEILPETQDVDRLWDLLSDWRLPDEGLQVRVVSGKDYDFAPYRQNLDLAGFRNNYLPEDFTLMEISFGAQVVIILAGERRGSYPAIHGMRLGE